MWEVEHLTCELAEDGGEVWMFRGGAYPDGIEVCVALQLNAVKDVAGVDEVANVNKLLYVPVHGGGNSALVKGWAMRATRNQLTRGAHGMSKLSSTRCGYSISHASQSGMPAPSKKRGRYWARSAIMQRQRIAVPSAAGG